MPLLATIVVNPSGVTKIRKGDYAISMKCCQLVRPVLPAQMNTRDDEWITLLLAKLCEPGVPSQTITTNCYTYAM